MAPSSTAGQDQSLRDNLLQNPEAGWKALWEEYGAAIRCRISSFRFSIEDVAEVTQEFSFRVSRDDFRILRAWNPDRCSLKGYLCVIATSCSLDFLKSPFYKQKTLFKNAACDDAQGSEPVDFLEDLGPGPDQCLFQSEIIELVCHTLEEWTEKGRLSSRDRRLLEMRLGGAAFEDISRILGVSRDAATKQYSRLKEELRKRLENRGIRLADFDSSV